MVGNQLPDSHRRSIEHPQFHGLRVSPQVYTTIEEVDRFGDAMVRAATKGI